MKNNKRNTRTFEDIFEEEVSLKEKRTKRYAMRHNHEEHDKKHSEKKQSYSRKGKYGYDYSFDF